MTNSPDERRCPTLQAIESWIDAPDRDADIATHVESCIACQQTAADIRANLELMNTLSRPGVAEHVAAGEERPSAFDDYEIIDEIHRGAQGIVYRATQRTTNRIVALKVLLAGTFATSKQRGRFEREIEIVAGLDHPNIVTVFDSGTTDDQRPWLAMQCIDGLSLDAWLDVNAAQRSTDQLLRLFVAICDGVAHAHQHGVIHRDLKPANILVDADDRPHIVDFGLARPATASRYATVTTPGGFLGTLAYASPEQTRGETVDTRSDVYALGVMLYQVLVGELPFELSDDAAQVIQAIRLERPPPLRGHGAKAVERSISADLETIINTALAKERDRRYDSAGALRDDILRMQRHEPIDARRDSRWYLLTTTLRRHRIAATVAGVFVVLLVAFSITVAGMYGRVSTEVEKLNQINLFLEDTLGSVEPMRPGDEVTVRQMLDETVHWIDIALGGQAEVAASIRTTVASSYRSLGSLDLAELHASQALETRQRILGDDHLETAESHSLLGIIQRERGQHAQAEESFDKALRIRRRHHGEGHLDVALTLANLGLVHRESGDFDAAERLLTESLDIRRTLRGGEHSDVAMCLFNLATVAERRGDRTRARDLHEDALAMRERVLHPNHPDMARSLIEVARYAQDVDPERAVGLLERAVSVRRVTLAEGHWSLGQTLATYGRALLRLNRIDEARAALRESLTILRDALGPDDRLVLDVDRELRMLDEAGP